MFYKKKHKDNCHRKKTEVFWSFTALIVAVSISKHRDVAYAAVKLACLLYFQPFSVFGLHVSGLHLEKD